MSSFHFARSSSSERSLSTRISEHLPKGLLLNRSKLPSSSIGKHILDYGHAVDRTQSFRILAKLRTPQILRFAEACAIRRMKPDLMCTEGFRCSPGTAMVK